MSEARSPEEIAERTGGNAELIREVFDAVTIKKAED